MAASGCEITRIASYEMYLKYKLESEDRAGNREHRFQLAFELNALKMSIIGEQLASEEKFDAVFVHSPQYSANNAVLWAFQKMGTPIYFLEGSAALNERYSNVRIWDWVANGLENPNLGPKLAYEEADLPSSRIASHFRVIRNGASFSVYSPRELSQRSALKRLGLISGRPTALLVLSSSDELLAARAIGSLREEYRALKVYESQVDWLKDTIDWFGAHPELQLVVRPHPRDFPTNREPEPASHTEKITEALRELSPNIRVDGPHKPLPLWSYFREVDVLITGWSSTALEALYNNVPVITFDGGATSFPSELSFTGNSVQSYKSNLQEFAAGRLVVTPKMRKAFLAWMSENYFSTTLALRGRF